jgi:hypothetical protein
LWIGIPNNQNIRVFVWWSYNNVPSNVITLFWNDDILSWFSINLTTETLSWFITASADQVISWFIDPLPNQILSWVSTTWTLINMEDLSVAYEWAKENTITTMPTPEAARLLDPVTRSELAKMIVQFSVNS